MTLMQGYRSVNFAVSPRYKTEKPTECCCKNDAESTERVEGKIRA